MTPVRAKETPSPTKVAHMVSDAFAGIHERLDAHHDTASNGNNQSLASPLVVPMFWSWSSVEIGS